MENRYMNALRHYSAQLGVNLDNDFVRKHAEELIYCFENNKTFLDFDFWTQYETLLNEKISYFEYLAIDQKYDGDPNEVSTEDTIIISVFKQNLEAIRKEALNKSEWFITDDDCLQCCRKVPELDPEYYELIQINSYPGHVDGVPFFQVAHGRVDISEHSEEEILDALNAYGYEDMDDFVFQNAPSEDWVYKDDGSIDRENSPGYIIDYQLIAEMFFEQENQEYVQEEFKTWNKAVEYVSRHTGLDLCNYKDPEFIFTLKREGAQNRLTIMNSKDLSDMKSKPVPKKVKPLDELLRDAEVRSASSMNSKGVPDREKTR